MSEQTVMIQINFKEKVEVNGREIEYSSALYYTPEQYSQLTQQDIDTVKQERVNNWVNVITTPQVVVEPTKEELELAIQQIEEQKSALESQKSELSAKLAVLVDEKPIEEVKEIG